MWNKEEYRVGNISTHYILVGVVHIRHRKTFKNWFLINVVDPDAMYEQIMGVKVRFFDIVPICTDTHSIKMFGSNNMNIKYDITVVNVVQCYVMSLWKTFTTFPLKFFTITCVMLRRDYCQKAPSTNSHVCDMGLKTGNV